MFSADWSLRKFIMLISSYMVSFFDSARVALHESQFQKNPQLFYCPVFSSFGCSW